MTDGSTASNAALASILETGAYSDLVIKCGSYEVKVHKAIICSRSEVFATMVSKDVWKEGREGVLLLKASTDADVDPMDVSIDDPDAVKHMVEFLYTHDYETTSKDYETISVYRSEARVDRETVMHAKIYALGGKYAIPSLQTSALTKFRGAVVNAWDKQDFAEALHWAFDATKESDKGLRDVAVQTLLQHHKALLAKPEIEDCVRKISGLAFDLFKAKAAEKPLPQGPKFCDTCRQAAVCTCNRCKVTFATCSCDPTANLYRINGNPFNQVTTGWRCKECRG
ncbi:hypothetical protein LTR86_004551 [Recurvomyces mirabilis]|nr:hypothetical protein LTR86_004551 [Recurvomyces mirabilis]